MSPELRQYYAGVKMSVIGHNFNLTRKQMQSKLHFQRKKLNLKVRPFNQGFVGEDVQEFLEDKDLILALAKDGMSNTDIASKWEISKTTVIKYMKKWGVVMEGRKQTMSLSDLYKGWADIPEGEIIITASKRPIGTFVRAA